MSAQVGVETPKDREDEYRVRRGAVRFLTIPEHRFAMVDGSGPAGGEAFGARMPGLYAIAYGLRFAMKRRGVIAKVGPLEGLWWHAKGATDLDEILSGDRADWRWTLMIVLPDVTAQRGGPGDCEVLTLTSHKGEVPADWLDQPARDLRPDAKRCVFGGAATHRHALQ